MKVAKNEWHLPLTGSVEVILSPYIEYWPLQNNPMYFKKSSKLAANQSYILNAPDIPE